jgi:anti-anti-sigma factor
MVPRSELSPATVGNVTLLVPPGNLVTDEENDALERALAGVCDEDGRDVLVDFRHVELINSVGLGIVIDAFRRIRARGGRLKLCGMRRRVHRIMTVIHLLPMIESFDTAEEALPSFHGPESGTGGGL